MQHLPQLRFAVAGDSLTRNPVREGTPSQGMGCFRTGVLPVTDSKPKEEQGSEEGVGGTSRMVDTGKEALKTGVGEKNRKKYSICGWWMFLDGDKEHKRD